MKAPLRSGEPIDPTQPRGESPVPANWLRSCVEHSQRAVGIVRDTTFTLVYANVAFRNLSMVSGARSAVVVDRPLAEAFNPVAAQSLLTLVDGARREGIPTHARLSADQTGVSGVWHCVAWSASDAADVGERRDRHVPIVVEVDASGHSEREETRHRDLTELLLLSAIREEARAIEADTARSRAEQARAEQDRFLAEVSHEMRAPMQAIIGYTDLIEVGMHRPLTDEQHEALGGIREGTRRVDALISELLQYATSMARRIEYALTEVDVNAALVGAAALVAPRAHTRGIALEIVPGRAGSAVRADAAKLGQIVLNLLANAVKFTAPGGTITLSWEVVAGGDGRPGLVAIRVADTGRGIASSELPRVFDPYVRVGEPGTSGDSGVGLGLAISRALAWGMNGELTVASTPGVGSVFTLTLPSD
jgi:signal transduction histidine kinase